MSVTNKEQARENAGYALSLILLTLLSPLFGGFLALFNFCKRRSNWHVNIICISSCIAFFSYCYIPENTGPDLYRYYEYMDGFKGLDLYETLTSTYHGSKLYAFHL